MTTVSDALNKAIQYHQNGNVQEAERIYTEVLKVDPENINCLYLMGLINYQKGKLDNAVDYANKALSIRPAFDIYKTLADIYLDKREFDNALVALKKAVEFDPDYIEGYLNIGLILQAQNKLDEAVEYYKKTISLNPDYYLAYDNLGAIYLDKGDLNESLTYYQKSMTLNPDNPNVYFNLANVFRGLNNHENAIEFYHKSLKLKPTDAECYFKIGICYLMKENFDLAIESFKKALEFNYDKVEAYFNIGNAYFGLEDYEQAKVYYNKAVDLNTDNHLVYNNLGILYRFNNELSKAIPYFLKSLELNPDDKITQFNLAKAYIANQNFEVGWDYYECRDEIFECYEKGNESLFKKSWKNDIEGKTILVNQTDEYGDSIELIRYLPLLHQKGARVITQFPDTLKALFKNHDFKAEIIDSSVPDTKLDYDARISSTCLPAYFKTNLESIPFNQGYLKPDPGKVKAYREKYFINDFFKVGIVWNSATKTGRKVDDQNMDLQYFTKLAELKNVKLYSLQTGSGLDQINMLPKETRVVDLGSTFNNFADIAAAVENLDLLISVDASVVHIAGAIGKKAWVLLPFYTDSIFFTGKEDTIWHESMKLYRQREPGNWQEMIDRVYNDLRI